MEKRRERNKIRENARIVRDKKRQNMREVRKSGNELKRIEMAGKQENIEK